MPAPYAAWAFNEGAGTVIKDYSGNGRDMTISGTNSWVTGKYYPDAFQPGASGADGAIWNNGSAIAALAGDVTVMLWYLHTAGTTTTLSHAGGLYSSPGTSRLSVYSYRNRSSIASSPHMTLRDSAATIVDAGVNGTVADSSWHNVAFVYHASGAMDEYLDGTLLSPTITPATANPIGTTVVEIGAGSILSTAAAQAAVQDMRVFASALTAADIASFMDTPVAGVPAGPGLMMASFP
jgi:alpha-N-arabinofuranosidase